MAHGPDAHLLMGLILAEEVAAGGGTAIELLGAIGEYETEGVSGNLLFTALDFTGAIGSFETEGQAGLLSLVGLEFTGAVGLRETEGFGGDLQFGTLEYLGATGLFETEGVAGTLELTGTLELLGAIGILETEGVAGNLLFTAVDFLGSIGLIETEGVPGILEIPLALLGSTGARQTIGIPGFLDIVQDFIDGSAYYRIRKKGNKMPTAIVSVESSLGSLNAETPVVGLGAVNQQKGGGEVIPNQIVVGLSGTFTATAAWQGSVNGVDWFGIGAVPAAGGAEAGTSTAPGLFTIMRPPPSFKVVASAYTSGAIEVQIAEIYG